MMAATSATTELSVIQANLNHCRAAQDLLVASAVQWGVGLVVVAEPYCLPRDAVSSKCGKAAILAPKGPPFHTFRRIAAGDGWVAAMWGELTVVSCYFSPKVKRAAFDRHLGSIRACIVQCRNPRVLVLGDFNAKSKAWGSPRDNVRGPILRDWAEGSGLRVLNRGSEPTCDRPQGTSIVDVMFATPEVADTVQRWGVSDEETLSDHRYVICGLGLSFGGTPLHRARPEGSSPRWALKRLDRDALMAAVAVVEWSPEDQGPCRDVEAEAAALRDIMTDVSDVAMPRVRGAPPRRSVYWWSTEIQDLRNACLRARHQCADARRAQADGTDEAATASLGEAYRDSRKALTKAIGGAKYQAWTEFLGTLDDDPWGRPYKMVRKKFRPWTPPITESLDPQFLGDVVSALFPERGMRPPEPDRAEIAWSEELGVTEEELSRAMDRLGLRDTAPGPDGIHGKVWCLAHGALGQRLRRLFDACLSRGEFPPQWREARLVLLAKEGRPADQPSAYRPICLLDEVGKLFERVIANRLVEHLSREGPDLAESQFGFREGRSTIDAINRVRTLTEGAVSRGGVALAISFDIANAFNTLPWERIREALRVHRVPPYLRRIIGAYLRDRWVSYPGKDGKVHRRAVYCGVPQGSVLGPLLWNLGYNEVLRAVMLPCVTVVCYADDTIVVTTGADYAAALSRAEAAARHVAERIGRLGLRVDLAKTEALWFHGPRRRVPKEATQVRVGEAVIRTGAQMKYLGLILDGTWRFEHHFDRMVPRIRGATLAFGRVLPIRGGPKDAVRRLYAGVVRSMALYGAPVWARDLCRSPQNRRTLLQMGRQIAIKVARTYRTVSAVVAHVLAGVPPFDLLAEMYDETYRRTKEIRQGVRKGVSRVKDKAVEVMKSRAWRSLLLRWQRQLAIDHSDKEIVRAVLLHFDKWMDCCRSLTYHAAQMLTGHGCFGEYLHRIGRESAATCRACNSAPDTVAHTLRECPAWAGERRVLRAELGVGILSLSTVVGAIVDSERKWQAFSAFCGEVLARKEAAEIERERRGDPTHGPMRPRRRRRGQRGPAPLSDSSSSSSSSSSDDADGGDSGGGARRCAVRRTCRGPPPPECPGSSDPG